MAELTIDLNLRGTEMGLIVAHPTGVWYGNQAGGTYCAQPRLEGFLLPVPSRYEGDLALLHDDWFNCLEGPLTGKAAYMDVERRGHLNAALRELELDGLLEVPDVETLPPKAKAELGILVSQGWGEAWLPVRIIHDGTSDHYAYDGLYGRIAVLTYENSD